MNEAQIQAVRDDAVPAAPWHLQGSACMSLWRVPVAEIAAQASCVSYATLGGSAFVVTVWASYTGGTLQYDEFAVAVPVRGKGLLIPACTVNSIWVNDVISAAGGRRLWHIPKALAQFEVERSEEDRAFAGRMIVDGELVASLQFEPGVSLPGRPALSGFVIQPGRGGPLRTRCVVSAKLLPGKARWDFAPFGPLGFLQGRRPLLSMRMCALQASFGV